MRIRISTLLTIFTLALAGAGAIAITDVTLQAQQPAKGGVHDAFGGIWVNTPGAESSQSPAPPAGPDSRSGSRGGGGGGRGGYGGRGGGGGGFGGGGGGGGRGGFGGAGGRGGGDNDQAAQGAAQALFTRELLDPVKQMTIVVKDSVKGNGMGNVVSIVTDDGHVTELQTNGKKVSETVENGFVKLNRTSKWDGSALVSEIAVKDGPTFEQRYELTVDGKELHVSTTRKASKDNSRGGFGGGSSALRPTAHVYTRPPADDVPLNGAAPNGPAGNGAAGNGARP